MRALVYGHRDLLVRHFGLSVCGGMLTHWLCHIWFVVWVFPRACTSQNWFINETQDQRPRDLEVTFAYSPISA